MDCADVRHSTGKPFVSSPGPAAWWGLTALTGSRTVLAQPRCVKQALHECTTESLRYVARLHAVDAHYCPRPDPQVRGPHTGCAHVLPGGPGQDVSLGVANKDECRMSLHTAGPGRTGIACRLVLACTSLALL